jgi:hypothetical protein
MFSRWSRKWFSPWRPALSSRTRARRPQARFRPVLETLEDRTLLSNSAWTGLGLNDNWSNAANWSNGVPGATDTATFSTHPHGWNSVSVDVPSIAGLVVDPNWNGFFNFLNNLTVSGTSTWNSGEMHTRNSQWINNGTLTISSSSGLLLSGAITNNGTIVQTGTGNLNFSGTGSLLTNQSGGLYDLQSDAGLVGINAGLVNASGATFRKSAGSGTSTIASFFSNQGGTIAASSGNLTFQSATYSGTSTFNAVNATDVIDIAGSSAAAATGTLTGSGNGTVVLRSNLNIGAGGAIASFLAPNYFQWQGGAILTGNDGLTVAAGKSLTLSGAADKTLAGFVNNAGTIVQTGTGNLNFSGSGTLLTNQSGGLYDLQSDAGLAGNNAGLVNASGATFRKSGGTNTSAIDSFFSNLGTVEARSGTLAIDFDSGQISGNTLTGGTWKVFDPATLTLNSGVSLTTNNGTIVLDGANPVFSNIANLAVNGGSFTVQNGNTFTTAGNFTNNGTLAVDGTSTFIVSGNLTNFSGTTLTGGTYQISGTFQFTNANILTDAATIVLDGATAQIVDQNTNNALANLATIAAAGRLTVQNGQSFTTAGNFSDLGTLIVGANGTFGVSGNLSVGSGATLSDLSTGSLSTTGDLNSQGSMTVGAGDTVTVGGNFSETTSGAALTVGAGSTFSVGGSATVGAGSALTILGGGTLSTTTDFSNLGSVVIGAGGTIGDGGNYTQSASASLDCQLGGTAAGQFGSLAVAGTATLNGTLKATLVGGYVPVSGDSIPIMTFASRSGDFTSGPAGFNRTYDDVGGSLTLVAQ